MSDHIASIFPNAEQLVREDSARAMRFWSATMGVLLTGWAAWFAIARVPVYAVSENARVESVSVHSVEAPVSGQIQAAYVSIGRNVQRGAVLVELDANSEHLREAAESELRRWTVAHESRLRQQLAAAEESLAQTRHGMAAAAAEEQARYNATEEQARLAEKEIRRAQSLFAGGLVPESQRDAVVADSASKRLLVVTQEAVMRRAAAEQNARVAAHEADVERLRADLAAAKGAIGSSITASHLLENDSERRIIRAPIAGRLVTELSKRPGAFVQVGERLTTIVPNAPVVIAGYFRPEVSIGRIRVGQHATFELDAFPAIEYGSIAGHVHTVAGDPKDGRVRVDVVITRRSQDVPLEHGLTGSLRIETETISPLKLVLRAAGKRG